ncbi:MULTISPECIES: winged helix-turn-helix transcriptional regulator [Streptomyces]|uniref:Helix-turn-helix transcriptional regulator n=1 Tax=Streptomyces caniscabiei TaxID=2746961 RepID=A0A927KZ35_9ACTN|nr:MULTISPECIES: helix-turn-helix domain-containing protein [Streptomyces]MBD9722507.1 helix-turn-helix transcriptional regulator [Streptomyces caniscabiei]MDX3515180.1 helix-turn-helix domain-containing protein [Streptomyces caniscabiei]MDX3638204.1 helix-turn-helix domain-containing protein [Streptomyces sp. MB09-02B]MDX3716538.1 helix-turn-helix domain-containing protein [Streptomyces caniscabiei]MDX3732027.1 helix-turn-helix domain-containing protein [Streptomyces caniscabiei]
MPEKAQFNIFVAGCPSRTSLDRIAGKWRAMVVIALGTGRMRFGDLRATVGGISPKVLTDTLRSLERDGLVTRHAYPEIPPRVEYELTALGRTLGAPLRALRHWAEEHIHEVLDAREAYDSRH